MLSFKEEKCARNRWKNMNFIQKKKKGNIKDLIYIYGLIYIMEEEEDYFSGEEAEGFS